MGKKEKYPNRIRRYRLKYGWSQEYVAAAIKMSWRHYVRIEKGETDPSASKLKALADLFGCRMEDLLGK